MGSAPMAWMGLGLRLPQDPEAGASVTIGEMLLSGRVPQGLKAPGYLAAMQVLTVDFFLKIYFSLFERET